MTELALAIFTLIISSVVIFYAGDRFAEASSHVGDHLKLSRAVKGATFDAIGSSLPELFVALFSVVFFNKFEVGIGTIAGSALFNLLVIPGLCVLVSPVAFKIGRNIINRDAMMYAISVLSLLILTLYFPVWGIGVGLFLVAMYGYYILLLKQDNAEDAGQPIDHEHNVSITREYITLFITLAIIGVSTYFLTESSITLAQLLGLPSLIVGFIITASATSIPDTIISVINTKKGSVDDAISNVFGSNIFDIFVGLGLPVLFFSITGGRAIIEFANLEILFGLLASTIIVLFMFARNGTLGKRHGPILIMMYLVFLAYVIMLSFGVIDTPILPGNGNMFELGYGVCDILGVVVV